MPGRNVGKLALDTGVVAVLMAIHLACAQSLPGVLGRTSVGSCDKSGGWTPVCGSNSLLGHVASTSSFDRANARLSGGFGGGAALSASQLAALRARIGGDQPMLPRQSSSGNANQLGAGSVGGGSSSESYRCINGGCAESASDKPVGVRLSERSLLGRQKHSTEFGTKTESGGAGVSGY